MSKFYALLTNAGINAIIQAKISGQPAPITHMAVGDVEIIPTQEMMSLENERHRFQINTMTPDSKNPNQLIIEGVIPSEVGGFYVAEVGIFLEDGTLFAIGNLPKTPKPLLEEGSAKDLTIKIVLEVGNSDDVVLKVDDSVVLATRHYVASVFFPKGTRLIFQQSSAPTGWTKETDPAYNDIALKFTTGNVSTGGSVTFSNAFKNHSIRTNISGSVGATTLSVSQMPSHSHDILLAHHPSIGSYIPAGNAAPGGVKDFLSYSGGSGSHTHSLSGASGSTTLNLAIKYASTIIAIKA